ncbi:hypothetical protein L204_103313 [Cryptococcus depauperatus]|nr:hypothetical protein L204_01631 [Cryptococcus depauperatus CBS 7855]
MSDVFLFEDPLKSRNNLTLTPFHIFVFFLCALSILLTNVPSPALRPFAGPLTRLSILLILFVVCHHVIQHWLDSHKESLKKAHVEETTKYDPLIKSKIKKKADDWEHQSAHPSHFLTTRDGKPRLFPFPLGPAGGGGKELWWEAGNAAHVGHYNQTETPAAKGQLRKEMEAKEDARQKKAKKAMKAYKKTREKWTTRLTHLKILLTITGVSLVSRALAVGCLLAWIYYVMVGQLNAMLEVKKEDEEKPAKERKAIPIGPGMAMTYLYEPDGGNLKPTGNIPTKAPSNRLMTSLNSRYAA